MLIIFVLCLAATICALGLGNGYVRHLGAPEEVATPWWKILLAALFVATLATAVIAGLAGFIGTLG